MIELHAAVTSACRAGLAFAGDGDPFAMLSESGRALLVLALVVPAAVAVLAYGWRQVGRARSESDLRPRGRLFVTRHRRVRAEHWRETVRALEDQEPTPIRQAGLGPVRIVGVIASATGDLGGRPGHECVWRNRTHARPDSAVGAEAVIVRDDAGACRVERIETAFVVAPTERASKHVEFSSLYVGDRVEVLGSFAPTPALGREHEGSTGRIYGTLGALGHLDVRLLERAPNEADAHEAEAHADPVSHPP